MSVINQETIVTPSLAVVDAAELALLTEKTRLENEWYAAHERFVTNDDIIRAAKLGELAWVGSNRDIAPVYRFRQPGNEHKFPPFLLPESAVAYRAIGRLWRERLNDEGINDPNYRIASTSFVRSEVTQAALVADGTKLASPDSTHCVGAPVDFDTSGYYWWSGDYGLMKVSHPGRDQKKAGEIGSMLGTANPTPEAPITYDQRVMDALVGVLDDLHDQGLVNHLLEFEGQANQCSHVAPHPDFTRLSVD